MENFDEILNNIKNAVIELAKNTFIEYAKEAEKDVSAFLEKSKDDIQRYTELLADKKISEQEFGSLLKGKKDLAEMKLLKQQGIALITLDKFKNSLIETIAGVIKTVIPI